ncbi:MAG: tetratricopeptide repeat protein [Bacteroidales bacterium]|nr:tetratricopeptide repeat protein [Bacteroidales bacterium]
MTKRRYPGITPFSSEQKNIFCGRDNDVNKLYKLILLRDQVLLYSESGMGKTSLLNAGVLPLLSDNFIPIQIRFFAYDKEDFENLQFPVNTVLAAFKESIKNSAAIQALLKDSAQRDKSIVTFEDLKDTILDDIISGESYVKTLWYYFKKLQISILSKDRSKKEPYQFILLFDQFEELFTYPDDLATQFKDQLYELTRVDVPDEIMQFIHDKPEFEESDDIDCLYKKLHIKTVYAIRSDRIDQLNNLTDKIPDIQNVFHYLKPLDSKQAKQAIILPAGKSPEDPNAFLSPEFQFEPQAINKLLNALSDDGKQSIEASQLQIVCQKIEDIAKQKSKKITHQGPVIISEDDLPDFKDIFLQFYYESINKTDQPEEASKFIENHLIKEGHRISLDERSLPKEIKRKTLKTLLDTYLLRCVPNSVGGVSYELSHDTLVKPILDVKEKRKLEEEKEAARLEEQRILEEEREKARLERLEEERILEEERKINEQIDKRKRQQRNFAFFIALFILLTAIAVAAWYGNMSLDLKSKNKELTSTKGTLVMTSDSLKITNKHLEDTATKLRATIAENKVINTRLNKRNTELNNEIKNHKSTKIKLQKEKRSAEIAVDSLNKKIAYEFFDKALFEFDEKYYNAAKLFALNALPNKKYIDEEDQSKLEEIIKNNDYPLDVFRTDYNMQMQFFTISPNEKLFATCGNKYNVILLWEARTGNEIGILSGHLDNISCLDFSPDNRFLASGSADGTIRIWNLKNRYESKSLNNHFNSINSDFDNIMSVKYHPTRNYIAALSFNFPTSTIYLWNVDKEKVDATFEHVWAGTNNMSFSNNGELFAFINKDNSTVIWNITKNKKEKELRSHSGSINCMSFSYDNRLLAIGSEDNNIIIFDWKNGNKEILEEHDDDVTSIQFSPNSYLLASGDENGLIKLWNIDTNQFSYFDRSADASSKLSNSDYYGVEKRIESIATLKNHFQEIVSILFIEQGNKLVSLGKNERNLKIWNITPGGISFDTNHHIDYKIASAEEKFNLKMVNSEMMIKKTDIDSLYAIAENSDNDSVRANYYRRILMENPNDIDATHRLAMSTFGLDDKKETTRNFKKYFSKAPYDYKTWNSFGNVYFYQNNYDSAIICYKKSIEIYPSYKWSWFNMGHSYYKDSIYDEAIISFIKAADIDPKISYLHSYLGYCYYHTQNFNESLKSFKQETEYFPLSAESWSNMGYIHFNIMGDTIQSIECYKTCLDIYPLYYSAVKGLEDIYKNLGNDKEHQKYKLLFEIIKKYNDKKYEEVESEYVELNNKYNNDEYIKHSYIEMLKLLGKSYLDSNKFEKAYTTYIELWKIDPFYLTAKEWFKIGLDFSIGDFYNYAIEAYLHSIESDTDYVYAWGSLGYAYSKVDDDEKAFAAYDAALKIDPEYTYALNNYAYLLSVKGIELAKAKKMAKKAIDLNPDNAATQDTYGWVLYQLGEYDQALLWIGKSIDNSDQKDTEVLEHYGDVLFKLDRKVEALDYWKMALEVGTGGTEFLEKKVNEGVLFE